MITVFIVDDHSLFRLGTRYFLENNNLPVKVLGEADSGYDLFVKLKQLKELPQVILLDILMPDMSGVEVLEKLRELYPQIKVLVLSSETAFATINKMMNIGKEGFISKAAPYHDLVGAIISISEDVPYFGCDISRIINSVGAIKGGVTIAPTAREREVMLYAASGLSGKEIANKMNISLRTVDKHKNNIFAKFGFKTSMDMVNFAVHHGIIKL